MAACAPRVAESCSPALSPATQSLHGDGAAAAHDPAEHTTQGVDEPRSGPADTRRRAVVLADAPGGGPPQPLVVALLGDALQQPFWPNGASPA